MSENKQSALFHIELMKMNKDMRIRRDPPGTSNRASNRTSSTLPWMPQARAAQHARGDAALGVAASAYVFGQLSAAGAGSRAG